MRGTDAKLQLGVLRLGVVPSTADSSPVSMCTERWPLQLELDVHRVAAAREGDADLLATLQLGEFFLEHRVQTRAGALFERDDFTIDQLDNVVVAKIEA